MKKKIRNKSPLPVYFLRLILLVIACGLVFGSLLAISRFFTVKEIQCFIVPEQSCPPDLAQSLEVLKGQGMFFINYSEQISQTTAVSQPVSLVKVRKLFPRTLIVSFQPESAAYILESQGSSAIISQSGKIFTQQFSTSPALIVEAQTPIDTGAGSIDAAIHHTIMNIMSTAHELQLPLMRITWVDKSTIRLSIENRAESFVLDSERPTLALHRLALVLKSTEYRDIPEPKTELDLRFTMPVLRTQP